ncbi:MAG TPA: ribbon-helix-helix protein, CopG family [Candidatus Saccharimonadales bacterium]
MSKTINISLPAELVKKIDEAAKSNYASRSDFIRESIVMRLKGQHLVDEWGDEGHWETIVDFRDEGHPDGIPAEEVIALLEKLERNDRQKRQTTRKTIR